MPRCSLSYSKIHKAKGKTTPFNNLFQFICVRKSPTQAEWGLRKAQNSNNGLVEAAHSVERGVLRENLHSTLNIEPSTFNAQPL